MPTKIADADYSYESLAGRLRLAPHTPGDRRQYGRNQTIQVTNNTTAEFQLDSLGTGRNSHVAIRLHGHVIAIISARGVLVTMAHGWRSRTTLSRMNDVLSHNSPGFGLFTKGSDRHGRGGTTYVHTYTHRAALWLAACYGAGVNPTLRDTTTPADKSDGRLRAEMSVMNSPENPTFYVPGPLDLPKLDTYAH
jgi:hypothetical protein